MDADQARNAESLDNLAKSAIDRFKTRLDWEWKARLGLWTALGAGTAFALSSEQWQPTYIDFFGVCVAMAALITVYGLCFAWPVHKLHAEDIALWQECHRQTAELVWNQNVPAGAKHDPEHAKWAKKLSWGQFFATVLFAVVFALAVLARAARPDATKAGKSKVTVEQNVPNKVIVEPK